MFLKIENNHQRGLGCRVDRVGMLVELGGRTIRSKTKTETKTKTKACFDHLLTSALPEISTITKITKFTIITL